MPLDKLAESVEQHIEKHSTWYLAILSVAYGVTVVAHASQKPFWYDELFTVYMCRLEGFATLWSGFQNGVDLNPPFMYGAVKASHAVFGEGHVGNARTDDARVLGDEPGAVHVFAALP